MSVMKALFCGEDGIESEWLRETELGRRLDRSRVDRLDAALHDGVLVLPYREPDEGDDDEDVDVVARSFREMAAHRRLELEFLALRAAEDRPAAILYATCQPPRGMPPRRFKVLVAAPKGQRFAASVRDPLAAILPDATDIRPSPDGRRIDFVLTGFEEILPAARRLVGLAAEHLEPGEPDPSPDPQPLVETPAWIRQVVANARAIRAAEPARQNPR
jgi:hypothetical protein